MSVTLMLFGARSDGEIFLSDPANLEDDGEAVTLRAITGTWAPVGWWGESIWRTVTVITSANVGATFRITPIVDAVPQDGTNGSVDSTVQYVVATPQAGSRTQVRSIVGLSRSVQVGSSEVNKVGIRGTWLQFLVETVGVVTVPEGEVNPDLRIEGVETESEPMLRSQQVVNA